MGKKTKSCKSRKILKSKKSIARKESSNRMTVSPDLLLQNAYTLFQQGNIFAAGRLFQTLLKSASKNPTFLNQMGVLAHMLGKSDIALDYLHKSLRLHKFAPFYNNLALVQEQTGDLAGARHSYEQSIQLDPHFPQAHYNLGNTLQKTAAYQDAIESYQRAIQLKQDYAAAYSNMGSAQRILGKLDRGEASCLAALKIQPDYTPAISNWCTIMLQQKTPEEVLELCEKTLGFVPGRDLVYGTLGDILADIGAKQEALYAYRKTLKFSARPGKIYLRMALLKEFQADDNDLQDMERSYHEQAADPGDRSFTCFAIGKTYEDMKDYHRAFHYIAEGNRLSRNTYAYSINEERVFFKQLKSIFNKDMIQGFSRYGYRDSTPVFIVGMPRSGTTLVEQILASHSQVYGAGELLELDEIIKNTLLHAGTKKFPTGIKKLNKHHYNQIGSEYISSLKKYSATTERIVDKMPHNFIWLGLISIALPQARIIHCRRDPMDTCWSIYKNIFDTPHMYAQDQNELGQYYRLYLGLMAHWKKIIPEFIYDIQYEDLVRDQKNETGKLLEFCKLPWENGCLDFHRAKGRIMTSSMAQVRKPIYSNSIKKWTCFAKELQPLSAIINAG